jgi:predicted transporter
LDHYIENTIELIERKKVNVMMNWKKIILLLFVLIFSIITFAQDRTKKVEMADLMRSNGRIYVVVAVMLTILIGLILYVMRLDKKISKMEKQQ